MIRRFDRELIVQLALLAALVFGIVTMHHVGDAGQPRPAAPITQESSHAATAGPSAGAAGPQGEMTHPAGTSHDAAALVHLCLAALVASAVLLAGAGLGRSLWRRAPRPTPALGSRRRPGRPLAVHSPPPRLLLCVTRT